GSGAEKISEEAPAPAPAEAGSPQGVTTPLAGLPGEVTQPVLPAEKAASPIVVVSSQGVTLPVLPGENTGQCSCLVKNIITAVSAITRGFSGKRDGRGLNPDC
ncbi:MAG: hypothetical protein NT009_09490, partial [Proteobacteria bacterium]|nr:hypothetical protein [Pseudomonadota bacterium]